MSWRNSRDGYNRSMMRKILQITAILVVLVSVALLVGGSLWLQTREPPRPRGVLPTAIIWTATPTLTPTPRPTPTPQPPSIERPAGIFIGDRVRVTGAGTIGLNIRTAPGVNAERVSVAAEGEIFIVVSGPQEADSLTWWMLRDEANPQREGWAAGNYLVEEP